MCSWFLIVINEAEYTFLQRKEIFSQSSSCHFLKGETHATRIILFNNWSNEQQNSLAEYESPLIILIDIKSASSGGQDHLNVFTL